MKERGKSKMSIKFSIKTKNPGYISGFGTVNAELKILDFLTFLGYYNKETKIFRGYKYNFSTIDVNYDDECHEFKIATGKLTDKLFDDAEWSYNCHDWDYIIKDFSKLKKKKIVINIMKEPWLSGDDYCIRHNLHCIEDAKNAIKEYAKNHQFFDDSIYFSFDVIEDKLVG